MQDLTAEVVEAATFGMQAAYWAAKKPDAVAVYDRNGTTSFSALNANANRLVRLLREHGLKEGDSVAIFSTNRAEFAEVLNATMRAGLRITPVNWHLTAPEIAYVLNDCEAKALIAETRFQSLREAAKEAPGLRLRLTLDEPVDGFLSYHRTLESLDGTDIEDPTLGNFMLYTSGTTGRPKGVFRPRPVVLPPQFAGTNANYQPDSDRQLCVGPAYHAAPLQLDIRIPLLSGTPVVFLGEKWDTHTVLRAIEEHRITHMHMVPIMFQRVLALPFAERAQYDLSSLRYLVHGAAPCPPEVKRAMIEFLGPILYEYYAGSEGGAGFMITSEEWLKKPASVGKRPNTGLGVKIMDENGNELPQGTPGLIYFQVNQAAPFSYYKDEKKTASAHRGDYFTLGDVGYFDEEDFLFLTGRTAECIISGGVNIYPQEVDNEIIKHPAVEDVCTIGVPNTEWGEEVKTVVMLKRDFAPSPVLAREILDFVRPNLAGFKMPRTLDFVDDLPRSAAGKIQRHKVRAPFWEGRARAI